MTFQTLRSLQNNPKAIEDALAATGQPVIITRGGSPIFAVVAIDPDAVYDHVLATAPEYLRAMSETENDVATGRTRPWAEVRADRPAS